MIGCALSLGGRQLAEQKADTLNGRSGMNEDATKDKKEQLPEKRVAKNRQCLLRLKPVM
jgi:hypothetical protein